MKGKYFSELLQFNVRGNIIQMCSDNCLYVCLELIQSDIKWS